MKRTKLTLASGCSVKVSGNIHRDASVSVGPFIWVWYRVVNPIDWWNGLCIKERP